MWHSTFHAAKVGLKHCHSITSWSEKFQNSYILHEKAPISYWLPRGFRDCPLTPEPWNFVSNISACHHFPPKLLLFRPWSYIFLSLLYQDGVTLTWVSIPLLLNISRWSSFIILLLLSLALENVMNFWNIITLCSKQ